MLIGGAICAAAISACGSRRARPLRRQPRPRLRAGRRSSTTRCRSRASSTRGTPMRTAGYLEGFTEGQRALPRPTSGSASPSRSSTGPTGRTRRRASSSSPTRSGAPTSRWPTLAQPLHLRPPVDPRVGPAAGDRQQRLRRLDAGRAADLQDPLREPGQPSLRPAHRGPQRRLPGIDDRARRVALFGGCMHPRGSAPPSGHRHAPI